jgi:hypothetical protein
MNMVIQIVLLILSNILRRRIMEVKIKIKDIEQFLNKILFHDQKNFSIQII